MFLKAQVPRPTTCTQNGEWFACHQLQCLSLQVSHMLSKGTIPIRQIDNTKHFTQHQVLRLLQMHNVRMHIMCVCA